MSDSAIHDTTRDYDAGLTFNYAQWDANTELTLSNVTWNNDYRDIVKFAPGKLDEYIDSQGLANIPLANVNYARPTEPIRISVPLHRAQEYNYIRARLPMQPVLGGDRARAYYYFITDVRHIAPNVTELILQLDIWQTFGASVKFGNSYIERGHIGMAHTKQFDNFGRNYLTIPEGLDVGGEYRHIAKRSNKIMQTDGGPGYAIMIISTTVLEGNDHGTKEKPVLRSARGDIVQGLPSGAEVYFCLSAQSFTDVMKAYSDAPWVTQGIVSITAVPNPSIYGYRLRAVEGRNGTGFFKIDDSTRSAGLGRYKAEFRNWRESSEILERIPERYRHLKKLLTFPYMAIEMTTWNGSPVTLKPESWGDADAWVMQKVSYMAPGARLVAYPHRYNSGFDGLERADIAGQDQYYDDNGDYLNVSTQISNFPTFALVNNGAINFLASNAHGLNQQFVNAEWSQQRTQQGIQTSYDQASNSMATQDNQNTTGRIADFATTAQQNTMTGINAIRGVGSAGAGMAGAVAKKSGKAAAGAVGSALNSGLDFVMGVENNNVNYNIRNRAANEGNRLSLANQGYLRDTNRSLAEFASNGDYANTIAGINARVKDAMLTQPSVSGQVGGDAFNLIHRASELSIRWKLISQAELRAVGEYFLRYGYAVRQYGLIPESLMVMTNFTYWKLNETYITAGRIPEGFKQALRGLFEKGVTVWNDPLKIGAIDIADNMPLDGVIIDTLPPDSGPKPLPINDTEMDDDNMINIAVTGIPVAGQSGNFTLGKGYIRMHDEGTGVSAPRAIAGDFIELSYQAAQAACRTLSVPPSLLIEANLLAQFGDHQWSQERSDRFDAANEEAAQRERDTQIQADLTIIRSSLAELAGGDTGTGDGTVE